MSSSDTAGRFDPAADERLVPGLIDELRRDPNTRVLVTMGDRARVTRGDGAAALGLVAPDQVPRGAMLAFLGRDRDGRAILLAATSEPSADDAASFRDVGLLLSEDESEMLLTAVALGRWLIGANFCPACGERARLTAAGWARRCEGCGAEHFPRTDPAVIVAPTSEDGDRLLLGANAAWRGEMFSCFAGFVEAGESAERAVHRELREETGIEVTDLTYIASQAWPYPRSLMLGFHARVVDDAAVEPDGEEIVASRWFTRDEIGRGLRGELDVRLPGGVSVAHRLIRAWYDRSADGA